MIIQREVVASTVVNDLTQGAILTIVAAFCICCSFLFLSIRLVIRRPLKQLFGKDDALVTIATILGTLQSVLTIHAVTKGLGTREEVLTLDNIDTIDKFFYATDLLYLAANYMSKAAVSLFFRRLSDTRLHRICCHGIAVVCCVFSVASILLLSLQSPVLSPWKSVMTRSRLNRWIVVESLSALVEVLIIAFPLLLVTGLQMKAKMKIRITTTFGLRIIIIPLAILRLTSFASHRNSLFDIVVPQVYLQVQMAYNVISATIPCVGIFLEGASPNFLGGQTYAGSTATTNAGAYPMGNMTKESNRADNGSVKLTSRLHGESRARASRAAHGDGISIASDASERAIMVRQTVDVEYSPDPASTDRDRIVR